MSWTEERVELLRKLWTDGLSASQIAQELAHGITRNAVIGKVHRLGLSGRAKAPAAPAAAPRQINAKPQQAARPAPPRSIATPAMRGNAALAMRPMAASAAPQPVQRPYEDVVIPISERVTIMDLRESMCRWPMGDPSSPDFRFCGARSAEAGGPYCSAHARIAYQPVQDRRRERDRERRLQRLA